MQPPAILGMVLATMLLIQGVPAPPALVGMATLVGSKVGATLAKGIRSAGGKRDGVAMFHAQNMAVEIEAELKKREKGDGPNIAPPGVLQHNWDQCVHQAKTSTSPINVEGPVGENHIRITGMPPACMNLATAIGGIDNHTAIPFACASDCIEYSNLSPGYYEAVRSFINGRLGSGGSATTKRNIRWSSEGWKKIRKSLS